MEAKADILDWIENHVEKAATKARQRQNYRAGAQEYITDTELKILRSLALGLSITDIGFKESMPDQAVRESIEEIKKRFVFATEAEMIHYFTKTKVLK